MKKCLLLFFFLLVSIVLLKLSEGQGEKENNSSAVKELVSKTKNEQIAKN